MKRVTGFVKQRFDVAMHAGSVHEDERLAHFFEVVAGRASARTSIDDGVKALALAEAATTSWREQRIVEP